MSSKIITILGGNGYIGRRCIDSVLNSGKNVKVKVISRSGVIQSSKVYRFDERVEFIKGDCLSPFSFKNVIEDSDSIIHSIGALLTTKPKNDPGSYEMMNKESCLRVAELANEYGKKNKKTLVYISSAAGLPFPLSLKFSGYIETKRKCEEELKKLSNLNTVILRPGFVVDSKDRVWSVPLKYPVDILHTVDNMLVKKFLPGLSEKLILPAQSIQLQILADYAARGALDQLEYRIYSNEEMLKQKI